MQCLFSGQDSVRSCFSQALYSICRLSTVWKVMVGIPCKLLMLSFIQNKHGRLWNILYFLAKTEEVQSFSDYFNYAHVRFRCSIFLKYIFSHERLDMFWWHFQTWKLKSSSKTQFYTTFDNFEYLWKKNNFNTRTELSYIQFFICDILYIDLKICQIKTNSAIKNVNKQGSFFPRLPC